ncbi:MAG TPA: hypothetical protein VMW95_01655 [Desulfobacterales bacterium]|nr:hypothetical protein [Desulfobacterales bacterium]
MKIIKIESCLDCPHIAWATYPVEAFCNHDYCKDETGKLHKKRYDEDKYWKIEDFNVIQTWCALEDAT